MKTCIKCHKSQPLSEFYPHTKMRDRRLNKCRTCTKKENTEWRNVPENRAKWNRGRHFKILEKQFGLSRETYDRLYQQPVCGGCGKTESQERRFRNRISKSRLALDHDHGTNVVRGLLCHDCNRTIATAHDNPAILRNLALYLETHKEKVA